MTSLFQLSIHISPIRIFVIGRWTILLSVAIFSTCPITTNTMTMSGALPIGSIHTTIISTKLVRQPKVKQTMLAES
jgi:hypothetical protein